MAIKIQYPVRLHEDTKCPSCQQNIISMGQNMYVCTTGHVIEGVVLVTMRPKQKEQPPVKVGGIKDEEPLTPDYEKESKGPRILPVKKDVMQ